MNLFFSFQNNQGIHAQNRVYSAFTEYNLYTIFGLAQISNNMMATFHFSIHIIVDDSSFWFPESGYSVTVFDHEGAGTSIFQWSAVQKDQEFLTYGILVDPKSSESSFAYYHSQGEVTGNYFTVPITQPNRS